MRGVFNRECRTIHTPSGCLQAAPPLNPTSHSLPTLMPFLSVLSSAFLLQPLPQIIYLQLIDLWAKVWKATGVLMYKVASEMAGP